MKDKIKIVIVDDHGLLRQGVYSMLMDVPGFDVVGTASSGEEAVAMLSSLCPDVFVMDIIMRGMSGIEATRWIKEQNSAASVLLISSEVNKEYIAAGIKSGADGYLPKESAKETLVEAINAISEGKNYFSPEVTALVFEDFYLKEKVGKGLAKKRVNELSKREEEVLVHIALGKSLREVADDLFISVKTVETHKQHILEKLGLKNTAQLVRYAIDRKLV